MKGVPFFSFLRRPIKINPSYYGLNYEEVSFYTRGQENRVLLRGWYIPSQALPSFSKKNLGGQGSDKCLITVHGWGANRAHSEISLLELIKELVNRGYNVFTFDLRAHGESEGSKVSFGFCEAYDILGAYDFVVEKKKIAPQKIGLMGFSYGAMLSILAAGKEKISGVVADSGPGDTFTFIEKFTVEKVAKFPPLFYTAKCLTRVLAWIAGMVFRIDVNELNTIEVIKKISTPIFFIHGTKDNIPYCLVEKLHQAKKRNPLDRMWTPNTCHTEAYKTYPKQYLRRVTEFFNKALKPVSK